MSILASFAIASTADSLPSAAAWPRMTPLAPDPRSPNQRGAPVSFAFEATSLVRDDHAGTAVGYAAASLILGVAASALGFVIARP